MKILYLSEVYLENDYWGPFHSGFADYFNSVEGSEFLGLNVRLHKKEDVLKKIEKFLPDFVFFVNYISDADEYIKFIKKRCLGVKSALWFVDSYERFSYKVDDCLKYFDGIFLSGNDEYITRFLQYFPYMKGKVKFLPFATDLSKFNDHKIDRDVDVSFVGTLFYNYSFKKLLVDNISVKNNYRTLLELLNSHREKYLFSLLRRLKVTDFEFNYAENANLLKSGANVLQSAFDDQLSKEKRLRYLSRLAEFNLSIHGEPVNEWIFSICESDTRLLKHFKHDQPIATSGQLSKLYNKSKIALNIQHHQAYNFGVAMRVFDVMACKALLLTEQTSVKALNDLGFEDGKDFVSFTDENDLYNKAKYYLNNEEARVAITNSAYNKVTKEHTFKHKISYIFHEVGMDDASKEVEKVSFSDLKTYIPPKTGEFRKKSSFFQKFKVKKPDEKNNNSFKLYALKPIVHAKTKLFGKYKVNLFVEKLSL